MWSLCFFVYPFLSRTGIETEVNVTVGFCPGLALAMGFSEALSSSFLVSIDAVTHVSTPFTILTHETVLSSNRDGIWTSILYRSWWSTNFCVQDWTDSCILENPSSETNLLFHFEVSCILGINVASVVLLLYQESRSIVLFRQASNPHQNILWIISGLLTTARISARILALGFSVAVHWSEFLRQKAE